MESLTNMLAQHGALVLFAVVFAEQVGLPFPALPLLVAGGVLVGTGHLAWSSALGAAILATLMADAIWYWRDNGAAVPSSVYSAGSHWNRMPASGARRTFSCGTDRSR